MRTTKFKRSNPKRHERRGTIIILVVGILAVLSVAALSYMTVVRLDRTSAAAHATNANFRQQVNATASHIRALLTADLFGNKIVTSTAPRSEEINGNIVWPKMFNDGEFWDYPSVDTSWLNLPTDPADVTYTGMGVNPSWELAYNEPAPVDDAWLASQQPVDADGANVGWDTWPQITNLRSGWLWQEDQSVGIAEGYWRRDHGRYVDIGEFLANSQNDPLSSTLNRGDPGLDISNFDTLIYGSTYAEDNNILGGMAPPMGSGPNLGVDSTYLGGGANLGTDLMVFEHQSSRLYELLQVGFGSADSDAAFDPDLHTIVSNIDERLWADTDGDGRADARWQELETLGELFGFKWVVAARIVDNSARINVNSSLEWQMPGDSDNVGAGRTPADIDLYRLLRRGRTLHPDVAANSTLDIAKHYNYNRISGLQIQSAFNEIELRFTSPLVPGWVNLPHTLNLSTGGLLSNTDPVSRRERELYWDTVGSAPQRRTTFSAQPAPIGDEIDLRAFEGSNFLPYVSRTEQRFEQEYPGVRGFLPGMTHPQGDDSYPQQRSLGPLRSRETRQTTLTFNDEAVVPEQNFEIGQYTQEEKLERLQTDIRHNLTTISGISDYSPIPPVSLAFEYRKRYINRKIQISDPNEIRDPVSDVADLIGLTPQVSEYVNEAFGAFMWALAPMATDQVTAAGLDASDMAGVAPADFTKHYGGAGIGANPGPAEVLGAVSSEYPILRSASLAINLADAMDHDLNNTESPTIAYFNPPPSGAGVSGQPGNIPRSFELKKSFSHGSIPNEGLNPNVVGANGNGIVLVGLDRQPFLMEVATFAVMEDSRTIDGMQIGEIQPIVDPLNHDDHVISLMAFELGNPWSDPINVEDYVVRLSNGNAMFEFRFKLGEVITGDSIIQPGDSKTFVITFDPDTSTLPGHFQLVRDQFSDQLLLADFLGRGLTTADNLAQLDPAGAGMLIPPGNGAIPYHIYGLDPSARSVQLYYEDPSSSEFFLVDRLSAGFGTDPNYFDFPWPSQLAVFPAFGFDAMFTQITGSGRAVYTSSLKRPKARFATGSFPSYVIEKPEENAIVPFVKEWVWPLTPVAEFVDPLIDPTVFPEAMGPDAMAQTDLNLDSGLLTNLEAFQLFVPNGPLRSVSELHMLCAFTHQFIKNGTNYDFTAALANGHLGPIPSNLALNVGPGYWRTISEQLGALENYYYNGMMTTESNPYLGVLDPTRYVLGGDLTDPVSAPSPTHFLPDSLRIPLANRVFDCFITTRGLTRLAQGKINLNTAPIETLESMPFFAPQTQVNSSMSPGTGALPPTGATMHRAQLVHDYRDMIGTTFDINSINNRETNTGITGLRTGLAGQIPPLTTRNQRGLVNVGELLAMANWSAGDGNPAGDGMAGTGIGGYDDFAQLGVDSEANDGSPLSLRYTIPDSIGNVGSASVSSDFNEFGDYALRNDYANGNYDPVDDPEERLALVRSALDIASTRSDVFTAWFIIRAYDPEQIEAISINGGFGPDLRAELMDEQGGIDASPGLDPVYETRWLGVFDRSEVNRPSDRPRVLMLVELPASN